MKIDLISFVYLLCNFSHKLFAKPLTLYSSDRKNFISSAQESMIAGNRAEIVERLDTSGILLEELRSQNVISMELYTKVLSAKTDADKNTILLDYMLKCSQSTLNAFIEIIQEQNQPHIAELFKVTGNISIMSCRNRTNPITYKVEHRFAVPCQMEILLNFHKPI